METKILTTNKWFWAWQDEQEENWLREMSLAGWHLQSTAAFGRYTFVSGEPKDYVYRLDFQTAYQKDYGAYLQLFQDAGWDFIGNMSGWQYFRKLNQSGETMEIFTDNTSKIQKYQRLLALLVVFLPIYLVLLTPSLEINNAVSFAVTLLWIVIIIGYIVVLLKIIERISQLRKQVKTL